MSRRRDRRWQLVALIGVFFLLSGIIYGKSLNNKFIQWDDGYLIVDNPTVHEISPWSVQEAFRTYDPELYIPLTMLSYQMDHLVWGLNPFGFHLTNLVLHTVNALLVMALVYLLLCRTSWLSAACHGEELSKQSGESHESIHAAGKHLSMTHYIALFSGLLFLVHPLHTEAVAWASSRKDVLSALFFLLSVCFYLKQWKWRSILAFALGLLAKVSIVVLPVILLLIDWFQGRNLREKNLWIEKVPYVGLSTVFGIVALGGKQGNSGLLLEKVLIGCKAAVFYFTKLFWPSGLSVLYPYTESISIGNGDLLISLLIVIATSVVSIFLFISPSPSPPSGRGTLRSLFSFCAFFYLITLTPSFTNFAKGKDILRDVYFASDRYAYLPSIGIILLVVILIYQYIPKKYVSLPLVVIPLLALLSYQQSRVWQNTETLFTNVVKYYPNSHLAYSNLGTLAFRREDYIQAADYYQKSLDIRPNSAAYFNLGQMLTRINKLPEAIVMYQKAIEQKPTDFEAYTNLGALYMEQGRFDEATTAFVHATTIEPTFSIAHFNLGLMYERQGKLDDARSAYERVLELDPDDEEARKKLETL